MKAMRTILIAQNDPAATFPLSAAMQKAGWSPMTTRDMESTVTTARKREPDAIILSSTLPGGGLEALYRLRSSAFTAATPVICIVPESSPDRPDFRAAGCLAMFAPPVNPAEIEGALKRDFSNPFPMLVPKSVLAESQRIKALVESKLMDGPNDPLFSSLTALIARILKVPSALVTVVGEDRQRFAGSTGLSEGWSNKGETPLTHSFCQWVVGGQEHLIVSDARNHPVLKSNEAIRDLGVTAYAGVPFNLGAQTLGSVCALDHEPRDWTTEDLEFLRDVSMVVEGQLASASEARSESEKITAVSNAIIGAARMLQRVDIRSEERSELAKLIDAKSKLLVKLTT